jgi:hypothetical protein
MTKDGAEEKTTNPPSTSSLGCKGTIVMQTTEETTATTTTTITMQTMEEILRPTMSPYDARPNKYTCNHKHNYNYNTNKTTKHQQIIHCNSQHATPVQARRI